MTRSRLIVAIDTPDVGHARTLARGVSGAAGMVKLGLEFFAANGAPGVVAVADEGLPVFLDLKLHDIPNTVAGAITALAKLRPALVTVHAAGGEAMIAAAMAAVGLTGDVARPRVLAVTVLTSLDDHTLNAIGVPGATLDQVVRLARLAMAAGADGVVCGPREVAAVRAAVGPTAVLVVPGVRPPGTADDDQARATTPAEAARAGADWVVVGRPISRAENPAEAARAIAAELAS